MPQTAAGRDTSAPEAGSSGAAADAAPASGSEANGAQAGGSPADAAQAEGTQANGTPDSERRLDGAPDNGTVPAGPVPAARAASAPEGDTVTAEPADPADAAADGVAGPAETEPVSSAPPRQGVGARSRDVVAGMRSAAVSLPTMLRRHWLASTLIGLGVVLRVLVWMAYHPAIVYIDSLKYLPAYHQWRGSDPIGYRIPLQLILAVGNLGTVTAIQHLLGVGMAVVIYALLIRRGAPRWVGALAIVPVLFDAYQLQAEAMIMPDVWFEAMIVAGVVLLLWNKNPRLWYVIAAGFIFGASAAIRQVGEIMIVPGLLFVLAARGGWRKLAVRAIAMGGAFCLAALMYLTASLQLTGHFWFSESSTSLAYGRMAAVADCATLKIPAVERPLCPTAAQVARGPDWLEHNGHAPYRMFNPLPPLVNGEAVPNYKAKLVSSFNHAVELQQPLRVLRGIGSDAVKLFGSRATSPGDTPLWRWQFQHLYPSYWPFIRVRNGLIYVALAAKESGGPRNVVLLDPSYGGPAQVNHTLTSFLRGYQKHGGYTPGLLFLLYAIAGLAGSLLAFGRRRSRGKLWWQLAVPCATFSATAAAVLLMSDFFEFTWRYQLPALVTLPPAGALGIAALMAAVRRPGRGGPAESGTAESGTDESDTAEGQADRAPGLAAPAG